MFKILKFINEFQDFQKRLHEFSLSRLVDASRCLVLQRNLSDNISVFENLLFLISKLASTFYYLLDNTNLMLQSVFGSHHPHKLWIKRWKDWMNLIRNWFQLFRSIMKVRASSKVLNSIRAQLQAYSDKVVGTTCIKATELVALYIRQKLKMYDHMFVLIRNSFRIIMLNYKLRLPIHRDILNPIVVQEVGVMMSITGIFKIWMKERNKNFRGRYIKMQEYLKIMPRMEQLEEMQAGRRELA